MADNAYGPGGYNPASYSTDYGADAVDQGYAPAALSLMTNLGKPNPYVRQRAMVDPAADSMSGLPSSIYVQMPNGQRVAVPIGAGDFSGNANPQLAAALMGGGQPINPATGQPLVSTGNAYGGQLWATAPGQTGVPLQVALGGNFLGVPAPGQRSQQDIYNQYVSSGGQQSPLTALEANAFDPNYANQPVGQTPTGANYAGQPNYAGNVPQAGTAGNVPFGSMSLFGAGPQPNYVSDINLPTPPQIPGTFDPAAMQQYNQQNTAAINNLGGFYNYQTPQMQAAQFNTGQVPQVSPTDWNATTLNQGNIPQVTAAMPQSFDQLQFLLSGQGYDPATLARMNATASDSISREQGGQLGSARIAAQQAGLGDSGASLAEQDIINRQAGDARTQALNQIAIQNAQQGLQNLITGSGMQLNLEEQQAAAQNAANQFNAGNLFTGQLANQTAQNQAGQFNAQTANQMALENAAKEFSAMTQNVQNQQSANQLNTQNQAQQRLAGANQQASTAGNIAQGTAAAQLAKQAGADTQNAANTVNTNLNQAELQRQRQLANSSIGESRYSQALGGMLRLAGSSNPYSYYSGAAELGSGYQPNLIGASAASNIVASLGNQNPYQQQKQVTP